MALSIKAPSADRLARELSRRTGETLTTAIVKALQERLDRVKQRPGRSLASTILEIAGRCSKLRVKDNRDTDQIVGYDETGAPR